jgi:hypothetical protein
MKKVIKLTESDLIKLVKKVIKEDNSSQIANDLIDSIYNVYIDWNNSREPSEKWFERLTDIFDDLSSDFNNKKISKEDGIKVKNIWWTVSNILDNSGAFIDSDDLDD